MHNILIFLEERYFYVGVLSPLFGENLYPQIIVLMRGEAVVVPVNLPVEDDGRRSRSEGFLGHLQFFRGDRLEAIRGESAYAGISRGGQKQS
jgi:hypothetical protein